MIDNWERLLRRTRPDVWWYWDIRWNAVPPGQSRRILSWPARGWHQATSVNRKQTLLTFFSYTPKPSITFSSVTLISGQNRSSPTSLTNQWHSTSCKPAQQPMRWHVNKSAFAWKICLRFQAGAYITHLHSIHTYMVHIHITNVPLQVISSTLMWHRYAMRIPIYRLQKSSIFFINFNILFVWSISEKCN